MRWGGLGLALLVGVAGCALSAAGQVAGAAAAGTVDGAAYVPTMTFDVASVRPVKVANLSSISIGGGWIDPHTSMLRLQNSPLNNLLYIAYGIHTYEMVGLPDWPWPTLFTIEAKSDTDADEKLVKLSDKDAMAEKRHMLQALLADRFSLRSHWETREGPIYNLVVSKAGRLEGAKGATAEQLKNWGDGDIPQLIQQGNGRGGELVGHACPMPYLVKTLADQFNRPITDKTGRTGKYDFSLKYGTIRVSDGRPDESDPTPSLEDAIQDQIGLKLESAKGPIQVLVIDHIEKPSEN